VQLKKLFHYAKRVVELGPRASFSVIKNRVHKKRFYTYWKYKAEKKSANHVWKQIADKHRTDDQFPHFFEKLKHNIEIFFPDEIVQPLGHLKGLQEKADCFANNVFDLLGSGPVRFFDIQWHKDFRLHRQDQKADCFFDSHSFYQDITIQSGQSDQLKKDIKVPWELSRCYHFPVLGQVFFQSGQKKYVEAFVAQTDDWIKKNPFMLGVNWCCPMEVAIRAINWICAFYYFKDSAAISKSFWERFVCSLYDHFFYLENNWEVYDSLTSNHYLSDLVGYFFLSFFFRDLSGVDQKNEWCYQEILSEFDKQIFDEGTDYEGSTSYHCLVTELFYLFLQLCKKNNFILSETFEKKMQKMFEFIDWCTPHGGPMVTVGDNDSGRILYTGISSITDFEWSDTPAFADGLPGTHHEREMEMTGDFFETNFFKKKTDEKQKQFPEFGLSIIKTKKWHITIRHHAYNRRQPSGHFHNDALSITLAVDGVSVFVDPGSFIYTPSSVWRNYFRSVSAHNTFYVDGIEPTFFDERLFALGLPEKKSDTCSEKNKITAEHSLYEQLGLKARRTILLDEKETVITLEDVWLKAKNLEGDGQFEGRGCWNFTLSPEIDVQKTGQIWRLTSNGKKIMHLDSHDLDFQLVQGWCSFDYGQKKQTKRLRALSPLVFSKKIKICFYLT